jgi:hypothetical protein
MKEKVFSLFCCIVMLLTFATTYTTPYEYDPSFCSATPTPPLPTQNGRKPCRINQHGCLTEGNPYGMPWVAACCFSEEDPCTEVRVRLKCCLASGHYTWVLHEWLFIDPSKTCMTVPEGSECL